MHEETADPGAATRADGGTEPWLDAERLDVYRVALEFQALANALPLGRGLRGLRDQLERASVSIVLNTAEAAGRRSPADRARFFGIPRGSTTECAAILDIVSARNLAPWTTTRRGRSLLVRIVQMLTRLCQRLEAAGSRLGPDRVPR